MASCGGCGDIYLTGNAPENFSAPGVRIEPVYSRADAARRLGSIAPALWALLAVIAADLILDAAAGERGRTGALLFPEDRVRELSARVSELPQGCRRLRKKRRWAYLAAALVCAVSAGAAGAYLLDPASFSSLELESVMGAMLLHTVPWAALALGSVLAASCISGGCAKKELELLRSAPKKPGGAAPAAKKRPLWPLRCGLCAAAVALLALGIMNGGLWDVLVKAINICTECIGLG